jgi:hypothetical protein
MAQSSSRTLCDDVYVGSLIMDGILLLIDAWWGGLRFGCLI